MVPVWGDSNRGLNRTIYLPTVLVHVARNHSEVSILNHNLNILSMKIKICTFSVLHVYLNGFGYGFGFTLVLTVPVSVWVHKILHGFGLNC